MGIGRMVVVVMLVVMVMIVVMAVVMIVIMVVAMIMVMMRLRLQPAHSGAERIAERAIRHVRTRGRGTLSLDMMMVAFLHRAHFGLEPQNLRAVFAHDAGGRRHIAKRRMPGAPRLGQGGALFGRDALHRPALNGKDLRAILTGAAIGRRHCTQLLGHSFGKGFQNLGVITEIPGLDELHARMLCRDTVGKSVDAVDQDA